MKKKENIKLYDFSDLQKGFMKDPEYKKAYEDLQPEFAIIKAIIIARAKQGITQRQLAERIGITQSSLARFEAGRSNPTLLFIKKLVNGLGLRIAIV